MLEWTKPLSKDGIGDGYDPAMRYQMIPRSGTRYMMLRTGTLPAEMKIVGNVPCGFGNFRVIKPFGMVVPGLPTAATSAQSVVVPPNIEVQFDITSGMLAGATTIEVREQHGNFKSSQPDLNMVLSVKDRTTRNFGVCYVFDQINSDTVRRTPIGPSFDIAKKVFADQANILVLQNGPPRTVTMQGSSGPEFNFIDHALLRRLLTAAQSEHGRDYFDRHDAVIFIFRVPIAIMGLDDDNNPARSAPWAIALWMKMDGRDFKTILVTPTTAAEDVMLDHTLPHEIGHVLGIEHLPEKEKNAFPKGMPLPEKRSRYEETWLRNLMFPSAFVQSNRLNGFQIERIHLGRRDFHGLVI